MEEHLGPDNLLATKKRVSFHILQKQQSKGLFLYQQENQTIHLNIHKLLNRRSQFTHQVFRQATPY